MVMYWYRVDFTSRGRTHHYAAWREENGCEHCHHYCRSRPPEPLVLVLVAVCVLAEDGAGAETTIAAVENQALLGPGKGGSQVKVRLGYVRLKARLG